VPLKGEVVPLEKMIDDSLRYNNRVIFMTGEQGQWRLWRLYFTPEETKMMTDYYLKFLEKMKAVGYKKFIKQNLKN
jgi:hypothetical protein